MPLCERGEERVRADLVADGGGAEDMDIRGCARYLGVVLGPEALLAQWGSVLPIFLLRDADVYRTGRGLGARLAPFRSHIMSLVAFKLQFVPESPSLVAVMRRALQRLTGAPWMALPPVLLEEGRILGIGAAATNLQVLARAVTVRVAQAEEAALQRARALMRSSEESDECLLVPGLRRFRDQLIAGRWHDALTRFRDEFPTADLRTTPHPQKLAEMSIRDPLVAQRRAPPRDTLLRRARRWCDEEEDAMALVQSWLAAGCSDCARLQ